MVSLSYNDLSVWNYFCCILSTSKVKCLGMRHVFAKGICNVFENKNYIFGKSDILIKVLLQNITQNARFLNNAYRTVLTKISNMHWPTSCHCIHSLPPGIIRKPLVFWCFQGVYWHDRALTRKLQLRPSGPYWESER